MGLFDTDSQKNTVRKGNKKQQKQNKKGRQDVRKSTKQAQAAQKKAETTARADLTQAKSEALPKLEGAKTAANQALAQGRDTALGEYRQAKNEGLGYLESGANKAQGYLSDALGRTQGLYGQARDLYSPLMAAANQGAGLYGNFFGLGGQAGFDQAQSDWMHSPLYQAMTNLNQLGLQGLDRQANARGNPYNFADQSNYLQSQAGQYLGNYIAGLRPYLDQQGQYAGDVANLYAGEAAAGNNLAGQQANVATGLGQNQANVTTGAGQLSGAADIGAGQGISGNEMQTGANESNVITGTGQNLADTSFKTGQGLANTEMTGATLTNQNYMNSGAAAAQNAQDIANLQSAQNQNYWNGITAAAGLGGTLGGAYLGRPSYNFASYDPTWSNTTVSRG